MKKLAAAAILIGTLGLSARAQSVPQIMGGDPLTRQILDSTSKPNGGVTAVVRAGSGQPIALKLTEVSAVFPTSLAPAAVSVQAAALKTAPGLTPKRAKGPKGRAKLPRRAVEQLRHAAKSKGI